MRSNHLKYEGLEDSELVDELRSRQEEIKNLLVEIRKILKEASDV